MSSFFRQIYLRLKYRDFRRLPKGWTIGEIDTMQAGIEIKDPAKKEKTE